VFCMLDVLFFFFFFFQAEDGIRDGHVTGVQTCALPISLDEFDGTLRVGSAYTQRTIELVKRVRARNPAVGTVIQSYLYRSEKDEIGRASCRERGERWGGAGVVEKKRK